MTTRHGAFVAMLCSTLLVTGVQSQEGFTPLFNGRDLTGWKVPAGDNGHWRVVDGVIDDDAESQAAGDKNPWSEKSYGDSNRMGGPSRSFAYRGRLGELRQRRDRADFYAGMERFTLVR